MVKLTDPDLPAGAIVETLEDGGALRNDGRRLEPAHKNPWYILATVAGEPKNLFDVKRIDENRHYWNGWMCKDLSDFTRQALSEKLGEPLPELSEDDKDKINARFRQALGGPPPDPADDIDLSHTYFPSSFNCMGYLFVEYIDFGSAHFASYAVSVPRILHHLPILALLLLRGGRCLPRPFLRLLCPNFMPRLYMITLSLNYLMRFASIGRLFRGGLMCQAKMIPLRLCLPLIKSRHIIGCGCL